MKYYTLIMPSRGRKHTIGYIQTNTYTIKTIQMKTEHIKTIYII